MIGSQPHPNLNIRFWQYCGVSLGSTPEFNKMVTTEEGIDLSTGNLSDIVHIDHSE